MLTLTDSAGASFDALSCDLSMPLRGNWIARVELGDDAAPAPGAATLTLQRDGDAGTDTFVGFVRYGGAWQGRSEVQMVGGAGGLLADMPARHYAPKGHQIDASLLAQDIADAAGEVLDASSSFGGQSVGQWTRMATTPARALSLLCDRLGLEWRVLASGAVWVGPETQTTATAADVGYETQERPEARALEVRPDRATVRPGMVALGHLVSRVVYRLAAGGVAATLYYGKSDRAELADAVTSLLPDPAYAHTYGATVVAQGADGLLEVLVDDSRVATLRRIPLRNGMPGARMLVQPGDRLRVAFENGAPDGAYAFGHDASAQVDLKAIARVGDTVDCGWFLVLAGELFTCAPHTVGSINILGTITSGSAGAFIR